MPDQQQAEADDRGAQELRLHLARQPATDDTTRRRPQEDQGSRPPALKAFAEMPHVIEVHRLTGEDCFLLKVLVPTPGQLETIVDTIARFGAVTTSLVLRSEPAKPLGKALLG